MKSFRNNSSVLPLPVHKRNPHVMNQKAIKLQFFNSFRTCFVPLRILWLLPLMVILQGCPIYGYKYDEGRFPSEPVNFVAVNSPYDDYNATSPVFGEVFPLCFSSNRHSQGGEFNFVNTFVSIVFSRETGDLTISAEVDEAYRELAREFGHMNLVPGRVNTQFDEYGPFALPFYEEAMESELNDYGWYVPVVLLYSSGPPGNQDIWFTHNLDGERYMEPLSVSFLNSGADDTYPCLSEDRSTIYFCSDRGGDFDIYAALPGTEGDLRALLDTLTSAMSVAVRKDTTLSSDGNDQCPYVAWSYQYTEDRVRQNNLLVFASDREGGYGGYDLYYSRYGEGSWNEPVNFGPGINTGYNEFRPIVRPQSGFSNDFMLFSSDRPGGKGGFDLYYVGIPDMGDPF